MPKKNHAEDSAEKEESTMLAPIEPLRDTALARAQSIRISSLDTLLTPLELTPDTTKSLPNLLLQLTAVTNSSWAYVARTLRIIRDTNIWQEIEDGKYRDNWDGFLATYTKGSDFSAARVSNLLGHYNWFEKYYNKIVAAKPEDTPYTSPQIPRERTMRFIMQYHAAFQESEKLLAMVFWYEVTDHDTLRAEVSSFKGDAYVAAQEGKDVRSKSLGGQLARPTFGPVSASQRDPGEIFAYALELVAERAISLVCTHDAYFHATTEQRKVIGKDFEGILTRIVAIEEGSSKKKS